MFNRNSKSNPVLTHSNHTGDSHDHEDFSSMPLTAVQMKRRTEEYLDKAVQHQITDILLSIKHASKQGLFQKRVVINPDLAISPAGVTSVMDRIIQHFIDLGYRVEHEYANDHFARNWNGLDTSPVRRIVPGSYIISWTV